MAEQIIHSTYLEDKNSGTTCINAVLKDTKTGATRIERYENLPLRVWVTKDHLRKGQNTKLLCENMDNVDQLIVDPLYLAQEVSPHLFKGKPRWHKTVLNSPFIYAADVSNEIRVKQHKLALSEERILEFSLSALDFETSMLSKEDTGYDYGSVIISSYCGTDGTVYQFVTKPFLPQDMSTETFIERVHAQFKNDLKYMYKKANADTKALLDKYKPKLKLYVLDDEEAVLLQTCKCHLAKGGDFCSIWNIDFDVPKLLERLKRYGHDPKQVLCDPEIPMHLRVCKYKKDNSKDLQHPSRAWNIFECSNKSQMYCSLGLFSLSTKFTGVADSYKLEDVATKYLGVGKVDIEELGHYAMQKFHKVRYCSYGAIDPLVTFLLEKTINNIPHLTSITEYSHMREYSHQTVLLSHRFFAYCKSKGVVPGCQCGQIVKDTDAEILNVGGNVIHPGLAGGTYANKNKALHSTIPKEWTKCVLLVSDLDVTSQYPSIAQVANISRDTKKLTILRIYGHAKNAILDFCSSYLAGQADAVHLCSTYFNLPNYTKMLKLWKKYK